MTADRKLMQSFIAAALVMFTLAALSAAGAFRGLAPEGLVALLALWPVVLLGSAIWFGMEVLSSLRRIEATIAAAPSREPGFTHGS
jgi:hypothetical protein